MFQKWSKEIQKFLNIKSQFILSGNIYDVFPLVIPEQKNIITYPLDNFLGEYLYHYEDYKIVLSFEPLVGFRILKGEENTLLSLIGEKVNQNNIIPRFSLTYVRKIIQALVQQNRYYAAIILNFSSRLPELSGSNDYPDFLYFLFHLSINSSPIIAQLTKRKESKFNLVIWILDKENDIPAWYSLNNPRVKSLMIPKPDAEIRKMVAKNILMNFNEFEVLYEEEQKRIISYFVDQTSGMLLREISSIVSLAVREKIPLKEINEAIRRYKVGVMENPWEKIDQEKIKDAIIILGKRVKGQPKAIQKASEMIRRAFFNLSGAQYSRYSQRPKGVLFFAGPTGVGKTELAKAITELLFGSETNYIRFDMSEFSHEHADQRLIGAPPGYVGYDVGGELTNAIKQNPFSVILFDEIEKAHPKILDIFLQILDDGRLTSGRGETVYFTESLIIFTSNLGIYEITPSGEKIEKVSPRMFYEQIERIVINAIEDFFRFKIARPEILNRIGENIIVFDFIRNKFAEEIFDKMMDQIKEKLKEERKIEIQISDGAWWQIRYICCEDLRMGGRGIGNMIEKVFLNPLSDILFELFPSEGDVVYIDLIKKEESWELVGEIR